MAMLCILCPDSCPLFSFNRSVSSTIESLQPPTRLLWMQSRNGPLLHPATTLTSPDLFKAQVNTCSSQFLTLCLFFQLNLKKPPSLSLLLPPLIASFTQIDWKSSTQVGCAWTTCKSGTIDPNRDSTFVVCKFSPPGNLQSKVSSAVADPIFVNNVGNSPVKQNPKTYDPDDLKDPNHADNPNNPDPKNPGRPVRKNPDDTPKDLRDDPESPKYDPNHPVT